MMKIIGAEYLREMKKSYVLFEMQDPQRDSFFAER